MSAQTEMFKKVTPHNHHLKSNGIMQLENMQKANITLPDLEIPNTNLSKNFLEKSFVKKEEANKHQAKQKKKRQFSFVPNKISLKENDSNSLDYSLILPTPVKEGGVRMAGRWKEKSISGLTIGPGYYECGYTAHHTQGVVFGSEEKGSHIPGKGISYVDKFTPNEVHKTIAYSFTKDKRDLSLNIEKTVAIPGPGHYTISDNVIRPKASSLLIIPDLKGSFTKNSDQTNLSFIDPKPSLKTNSNFQKFSKVSRFLNENFRYRSYY